jgi:rhodanese-related sulfurtransferase
MPRSSRHHKKNKPVKPANPADAARKTNAGSESFRAKRARAAQPRSRKNRSNRTGWAVALIIVGVLVAGLLAISLISENLPWQMSDEISPAQANKQLSSGALIVDVRNHDEFVAGHINQSLLMPLEELPTLMQTLPHDRLIITVCSTGVRSTQARNMLKAAGFTQVVSMKNGIEAWIAAGLPIAYGEPVRNN